MACLRVFIVTASAVLLSPVCGKGNAGSPANLRSQTMSGKVSSTTVLDGNTTAYTSQVTAAFDGDCTWGDADCLSLRVDISDIDMKGLPPKYSKASFLFNAYAKKFTVYTDSCLYWNLPELPPPFVLKPIIQGMLAGFKATGKEGGYTQWVLDTKMPGLTGHTTMDLDDSDGVHKFTDVTDATGKEGHLHAEATMEVTEVHVGKPAATKFQVPAAWGACKPGPTSDSMPTMPDPVLQMLMERAVRLFRVDLQLNSTVQDPLVV